MVTETVNTAAAAVMMPPVEKQPQLALDGKLLRYRSSLAVLDSMCKQGILSARDHRKSCDILADKYGLSLCSIFRR